MCQKGVELNSSNHLLWFSRTIPKWSQNDIEIPQDALRTILKWSPTPMKRIGTYWRPYEENCYIIKIRRSPQNLIWGSMTYNNVASLKGACGLPEPQCGQKPSGQASGRWVWRAPPRNRFFKVGQLSKNASLYKGEFKIISILVRPTFK